MLLAFWPSDWVSQAAQNTVQPPLAQIIGRQLYVNGEPFHIQGVCYSPVPVGETPAFPPHGDYFGDQYQFIWKRDLALIKAMGATTIRLYGWDTHTDHRSFLDEVHAHGLKTLVTFFLGMAEQNPVDTAAHRQKIIDSFAGEVSKYAGHPALLMWSFGNELNGPWNGFIPQLSDAFGCGWTQGCLNNPWGADCSKPVNCVYTALFTFINDAATAAKNVTDVLVTSGFADLDSFVSTPWPNPAQDKIPQFEHLLPSMDMWAMQLYRGKSFGNYFSSFASESTKPLLVTEFGVDAYNDPCGWPENFQRPVCFNMYSRNSFGGDVQITGDLYRGCQDATADCALPGVEAQMNWDVALATEIMEAYPEKGGALAGGFLMAWTDEFWKGASVQDHCNNPCPVEEADECRNHNVAAFMPGGTAECSPHAHFTCDNSDSTYHDLCGYWLYSAPDHYVNEEWFGITEPVRCHKQLPDGGHNLDTLSLRPVYHAMQKLWRPGFSNTTKHPAAPSCFDLLPCYDCITTFTPKQVTAGFCDNACKSVPGPPAVLPPTAEPWQTEGFWNDYAPLILCSLAILTVAVAGMINLARKQHKEDREILNSYYGSMNEM